MRSGIWCFAVLIVAFGAPAFAYDWSTNPGNGEPNDPYQISEPSHLMSMGSDPNLFDKHFILTEDIDLDPAISGNVVFTGAVIGRTDYIGPNGQTVLPFTGIFNGNHHTISNLTINAENSGNWSLGLFAFIRSAEIRDLTVEEASITGAETSQYVGIICGRSETSHITHCSTGGIIQQAEAFAGGLAGNMFYSNILRCDSSCMISVSSNAGGLAGYQDGGLIYDSYATGDVTVVNSNPEVEGNAGGLVGTVFIGTISNCYATGRVSASSPTFATAGGLIGHQSIGFVSNCFTSNQVDAYATDAKAIAGGITGYNDGGQINRCYSTGPVTASTPDNPFCASQAGGLVGYQLGGMNYNLIRDCYAMGSANAVCDSSTLFSTTQTASGGLVGCQSGNSAYIENCFSTGKVSGTYNKGGFLGLQPSGDVIKCYWDTESSEIATSAAGIPLDGANMMIQDNFIDWDFVDDGTDGVNNCWRMCVDGVEYPRLSWEFSEHGDFVCPDGVGIEDLEALAAGWLAGELDINYCPTCDPSGDALINLEDFSVLAEHWLRGVVPFLVLSDRHLFVSVDETGPNPTPMSLMITNRARESCSFTIDYIGGQPAWLDIIPTGGSLNGYDETTLTVAVDVIGPALSPGLYEQAVAVLSPEAVNSPQIFTVHLTVVDQFSYLTADPNSFSLQVPLGGPNPTQTSVVLENSGDIDSDFTVNYPGGRPDWLDVTPTSGMIGPSDNTTLSISVDVIDPPLPVGSYSATLEILDPESPTSPVEISVALEVTN